MRLLLTRPREDAEPLARCLQEKGHEVLLAPMLEIRPVPEASLALDGVQAILLTSANGARALASVAKTDETDQVYQLPVFAVGAATAGAAEVAGFVRVESAGGDVAALADLVVARTRPEAGALLHAAGSRVAGDLAGNLAAQGFEVRRAVLYEAAMATELPAICARALARREIDAVLIFSPRTAATFVRLVVDAGLAEACRDSAAFCLSRAVADEISALDWRKISVAERPDQATLLALLEDENG